MAWVLDLDGVVWLAGRPIPGSPEAVARLRAAGETVVFLTNNSGPTLADTTAALVAAGVEALPSELATSAQAAATLLAPGQRAAVVGGAGVHEALAERGVEVVASSAHPDAVVVGRAVLLDYDELAAAATAIRDGARFVATNTDSTFPTGNGLLPGAGALIAFLRVASGRDPEVAGKPHAASVELVRSRFGAVDVMVGDRADTDGRFARAAGARFALVLSGVTGRDDLPVDPDPDVVAADLGAVVEQLLDSGA
jgi:4-nitrophenyl phosphatase